MKKNIGYINIDSSLAKWLLDNLPNSELKQGLTKLIKNEYNALMVETDLNPEETDNLTLITYKKLVINERLRKVEMDNVEVILTPKEYDILVFLAKNRGEVFTKEQIYQSVWEENYYMDDSNIMAFIRKLRKKIEPNPDDPEYILTVWGIGYKFNDQ